VLSYLGIMGWVVYIASDILANILNYSQIKAGEDNEKLKRQMVTANIIRLLCDSAVATWCLNQNALDCGLAFGMGTVSSLIGLLQMWVTFK
jgi:hypothetical protein